MVRSKIICLAVAFSLLGILSSLPSQAQTYTDKLHALQAAQTVTLDDWQFNKPDVDDGEAVHFNDLNWQTVHPGFSWAGENTKVWFRAHLTIPARVNGLPTKDASLRMQVGVDDDGEIYVDGKLRQQFHWDDGDITVADRIQPGQTYVIAVRGINTVGNGQLRFCRLTYGLLDRWQPALDQLTQEVEFLNKLQDHAGPAERSRIATALKESEAALDIDAFRTGSPSSTTSLTAARNRLMELAPLIRSHDVTYVGHAHIDMNWLWTWAETIDVCHRTWDSALKLMGSFPDFGFVQSQPGAYVPIQQQFPDEFAKMKKAVDRGQWDPVGGLWDESDTNMPSGEALARSLFLGQRYFKENFGRYAVTGWLPDSFGHSWQVPQLLQGVGIQNFYHTRCGDGIRFSWWESPDGSRVLKANTDDYDPNIEMDQLLDPWDIEKNYHEPHALVVFGVGDHGGGPTRQQILKGKSFQDDPLLPKVQFSTADAFFDRLRAEPQTAAFPVVNRDLQYAFEGCYTSHADLKKAVRSGENLLYSAEAMSSLAAMNGRAYEAAGLTEAWKPVAFAQFHDIMCGTAIHSTYTWMESLLDPAHAYADRQATESAKLLTSLADTHAALHGEQPVVVWNLLSFPRSDVIRMKIANARDYHSARTAAGKRVPVQALDDDNIAFVAQDVPAFSYATYYLSTVACPSPELASVILPETIQIENGTVRIAIDRSTGNVKELCAKEPEHELLQKGAYGNVLQVLGDSGNAWGINFTGEAHALTTQGAVVELTARGPVFASVRVKHTFGTSAFTQDIVVYATLPRIDIPTTVDWRAHGYMLKAAFPLEMEHPAARVAIPYGSIARPTNGQENPGQKWMDVSEETPASVTQPVTLDLAALLNNDSSKGFDNGSNGYDPALIPHPGSHTLGRHAVPFLFSRAGAGFDNVSCQRQSLPVPADAHGKELFLLGSSAPRTQLGIVEFTCSDGTRSARTFMMNDWILNDHPSNEAAITFDHRRAGDGSPDAQAKPHLWIVRVSLPEGKRVTSITLPNNPLIHLFAVSTGDLPEDTPQYGLTVLNDSKYGSDTNGSVFRLSLLRSSHDPDPNPDEGFQYFTYALLPHSGDWRHAHAEEAGLALNIPLHAELADVHPGTLAAHPITVKAEQGDDVPVVGAFKHSEDGNGYILRLYETQGTDTVALLTFPTAVKVEETDLLERPLGRQQVTVNGSSARIPVGHFKIVTLHITGLPDAGAMR